MRRRWAASEEPLASRVLAVLKDQIEISDSRGKRSGVVRSATGARWISNVRWNTREPENRPSQPSDDDGASLSRFGIMIRIAGESRRSRPGHSENRYSENRGMGRNWERLPNQPKSLSRTVLCLCLSSLRFPPSRPLNPHLRCGAHPPMLTAVEITLQGKFPETRHQTGCGAP